MSDDELVVIGVLVSFLVAAGLWYLVEDEIERLWHERELKKKRKRGE